MIHVLFICHGNICRSPMAEYLFRDMVEKRGLSAQFHIASAATSREEIGNGVYPPAKRKLASVGISCNMHHARQVTKEDYTAYDYLLVAERYNIPNLMRQIKEDPDHKVYRLLDFSSRPRDIADPWYTGDFDITCPAIMGGAGGLSGISAKRRQAITRKTIRFSHPIVFFSYSFPSNRMTVPYFIFLSRSFRSISCFNSSFGRFAS